MPEFLAPGVYVEEIDLGVKPIEGVSTSTAGFLGPAERGPVAPQFITGLTQFMQVYGGFLTNSYLAYAVDGFFRNGGQRCFVGRIVGANAATAEVDLGPVRGRALGPGDWGNRVFVKVENASLATAAHPELFKLTVYYWRTLPPAADGGNLVDPGDPRNRLHANRREADVLEVYDNLSPDPTSSDAYERRVNGISRLITMVREAGALPTDRPTNQGSADSANLNGTGKPGTVLNSHLAGGTAGDAIALADYQGRTTLGDRTGLAALADIDEVAIVAIPDEGGIDNLTGELVDHCERLKDRFAVSSVTRGAPTYTDISNLRPPRDTRYAALYYPWVTVIDPVTGSPKPIPPTGHVVGIYARSDTERGVHKAPANEVVLGAVDVDLTVGKPEQDLLNPRGVNVIRAFSGRGIRVWGARTMSSDGAWKYVNVRRLFLFLEESIDEGTQYAVFEPNDTSLWEKLRGSVTAFLTTQWRAGMLQGATAAQAFFVKIGLGETMTQDDIDNGRVIMLIGVAPVKPAEFVIFRITQMPRGATVNE
jgi:phage tail sheath protein FI